MRPESTGADRAVQQDADGDIEGLIAELRGAVAARDDFITVAAHELRNPMTPIAAQVQLLLVRARREGASAATMAGLERLDMAIGHYIRRATALLEISRVNAGQLRLTPTAFDMAELVAEATAHYETLAVLAGSPLRCDAEGPMVGTWDRLSTEQILDNLISNAIRYGYGKPIDVALAAEHDGVAITVADRGAGIEPTHLERIFGRFEQIAGTDRRNGGFGIGLWLVRNLVEAQGGRIEVESDVGAGSTFRVHLPRDITGAMRQQGQETMGQSI